MLHHLGAVTVSSVLVYAVAWMVWLSGALDPVTFRLKNERVIVAYLQRTGISEQSVTDSIREVVGASATRKAEVVFHDPKAFLSEVSDRDKDLGQQLMGLGRDMTQVIPTYVSVVGSVAPDLEERLRSVPGVESVDSSESRYRPAAAAFRGLQAMSIVLALGLGLAWLTVMAYMVQLDAIARASTDRILELWGGTRFQVRARSLFHALSVGLLSGGIAAAAWVLTSRGLGARARAASHLLGDLRLPDPRMGFALILGALVASSLAGAFGSRRKRVR